MVDGVCVCVCVCVIAVWCVDPGHVVHATRQTVAGYMQAALYAFDSRLSYSCDGGRRFEDGLTSRIVVCDVRAVWNDSAFTCDCTCHAVSHRTPRIHADIVTVSCVALRCRMTRCKRPLAPKIACSAIDKCRIC